MKKWIKKKPKRIANQFGCYMGNDKCCKSCMLRACSCNYVLGLKEGIGERSYISPSQQIRIKDLEKMQSRECEFKK